MLVFREANKTDVARIADLHATSWQQNYRDVFSEHFLDNEVFNERLAVWNERFTNPPENQHIVLSEEEGELLGFSCIYFNQSNKYGTYLDNLHVSKKVKGKGIGSQLMGRLVDDILSRNYNGLYLWVIDNNIAAINFYQNLNGEQLDRVKANDIGDKEFIKIRYVWKDLIDLRSHIKNKIQSHEH